MVGDSHPVLEDGGGHTGSAGGGFPQMGSVKTDLKPGMAGLRG